MCFENVFICCFVGFVTNLVLTFCGKVQHSVFSSLFASFFSVFVDPTCDADDPKKTMLVQTVGSYRTVLDLPSFQVCGAMFHVLTGLGDVVRINAMNFEDSRW